ncbi:MAG: zinc-dependent alcohol dehydrogenase family protein [Flavobacteriaceae bacterium]
MKAILFEQFNTAPKVVQLPSPDPEPHGVVLAIKATGMCLSDWHGWKGHDSDIELPHVPGHELAGEIVAMGKAVRGFSLGDRVTVPFVCACGFCSECHSGNHQVCDQQSQPGFTHWGSFAEFMKVDYAATNLVPIPEGISNETASLLGCRFTTAFRALVAQGRVQGGQYVAVHGCGGVGLSAIMIATALGAQVIAIDINPDALQIATKMGAFATINAAQTEDVPEAVRELSGGGVHVSLDASGHPNTCFHSIANLRKRGTHVQVGLMTATHQHPQIPMDLVIANELEIRGSHGMQAHKFEAIFKMIAAGIVHPQRLLERTISLEESADLLPKMNQWHPKGVTVINQF